MLDKKYTSDGPKVLLVEGVNDCHVIWSLCSHFAMPDIFDVYVCGSDDKVIRRVNALLAAPTQKETIGICLDADNPNLKGKWDAISNKLREHGYTPPVKPDKDGTILIENGRPTVGIWLMPDNDIDGMLEDFCLKLAPPNAVSYAQECVHYAKAQGHSSFSDTHNSKATVHTYLAWQDEPGMPLGLAITAKALNPASELASVFNTFLNRLFSPAENMQSILQVVTA